MNAKDLDRYGMDVNDVAKLNAKYGFEMYIIDHKDIEILYPFTKQYDLRNFFIDLKKRYGISTFDLENHIEKR